MESIFATITESSMGRSLKTTIREVVAKGLLAENPIRQAYEPFIDELRNGEL